MTDAHRLIVMRKAIREALNVRAGEVLTPEIVEERTGNIVMAVFAALPPMHKISVLRQGDVWHASCKYSNIATIRGSAFTARDAVVNFFKEFFFLGADREQDGSQLFEIEVGKLP